MMRVLFYLPVVTRHWLNTLLAPLIRRMEHEAEVHIVAPVSWRNTGITEAMLRQCQDLTQVRWHLLDGPDHQSYRIAPEAPEALIDFVRAIGPDYSFCRSTDITTPMQFPGEVRFLMEGDYPPLLGDDRPHSDRIMLSGPRLFDYGAMPPLTEGQRVRLRAHSAPLWEQFRARDPGFPGGRQAYLAAAGLPDDRPILAVPLQFESTNNFFEHLCRYPGNEQFFAELLRMIDGDCILAVTPHPQWAVQPPEFQEKIFASLKRIAGMDPDRVRVVTRPGDLRQLTRWLTQYSDGMILRDSKTIATAAFYGKPFLRLSHFASGDWMNAYTDPAAFLSDIRAGRARAAALEDALTWFAFHHANNSFVPQESDQSFAQLLDRVDKPVNPDRWEANLQRHRRDFANWFATPLAGKPEREI